jgi:hypothetical protein
MPVRGVRTGPEHNAPFLLVRERSSPAKDEGFKFRHAHDPDRRKCVFSAFSRGFVLRRDNSGGQIRFQTIHGDKNSDIVAKSAFY